MHAFHRLTLTAGIAFLVVIAMAGIAFTHSPGPNDITACYRFYTSPDDNEVRTRWEFSVVPTGAHYLNWCEAKDTLPNNWDDPGSSVDPCKSSRHYPGEFGKTIYLSYDRHLEPGEVGGGGWPEWSMAPARYVFFVTINYPSTTPHHDNGNHVGMLLADFSSPSAARCP